MIMHQIFEDCGELYPQDICRSNFENAVALDAVTDAEVKTIIEEAGDDAPNIKTGEIVEKINKRRYAEIEIKNLFTPGYFKKTCSFSLMKEHGITQEQADPLCACAEEKHTAKLEPYKNAGAEKLLEDIDTIDAFTNASLDECQKN
jgi:hypothetical protein